MMANPDGLYCHLCGPVNYSIDIWIVASVCPSWASSLLLHEILEIHSISPPCCAIHIFFLFFFFAYFCFALSFFVFLFCWDWFTRQCGTLGAKCVVHDVCKVKNLILSRGYSLVKIIILWESKSRGEEIQQNQGQDGAPTTVWGKERRKRGTKDYKDQLCALVAISWVAS